MGIEIFKIADIPGGYYEISNKGVLRSIDRVITQKNGIQRKFKGQVLIPHMNGGGYLFYWFRGTSYIISRLVAKAFIPNPLNLPQVNHKDKNRLNNFVYVNPDGTIDLEKSNLEWCTAEYNINYDNGVEIRVSTKKKNYPNGEYMDKVLETRKERNCNNAEIPVSQYALNGEYIDTYKSISEASRKTNVNSSSICKCLSGERKTAGTKKEKFIWAYAKTLDQHYDPGS